MGNNVQSAITNGKAKPISIAKATADIAKVTKDNVKATTKRTTTLSNPTNGPLTEAQALDIAFDYGTSMAGVDGTLTKALRQFNGNKAFNKRLIEHIAAGYYVRKLGYDKDKALATAALMKHNPEKQSDEYRTYDEEKIMVSVRMLVGRAKTLAGIVDPDQVARQEKANTTKEETKREKEALEARRNEAWEIVHPDLEEIDVNAALRRMFATMQNFVNANSAKITGDTGSAWREWLAKAPKVAKVSK